MNSIQKNVAAFYDQNAEYEWNRLKRHRTEWAITLNTLKRHLPPAPARVLDCGGGPGRYSIELTLQGYEVTLFDLSAANLTMARSKADEAGIRLAGIEQGSATDLERFEAESFEAVLLMGPLYHLLDEADRLLALAQAWRVLKPGGLLVTAWITRYAPFRDATRYPEVLVGEAEEYQRILETGQLPSSVDGKPGFVAYFVHPDEVIPQVRAQGFEILQIIGAEGVVAGLEEKVTALEGDAWQAWVRLNDHASQDPCLRGAADHLLVVARRPKWQAALCQVAAMLEEAGVDYKVVGGTCAVLQGVELPVNDIDITTSKEGVQRIQSLFAQYITLPVSWREGEKYRSYFGRFEFAEVKFDVMAELEWRVPGGWMPVPTLTVSIVKLQGQPVRTAWLEEETAAYIRRRRLDRASLCLPLCDGEKMLWVLAALGEKKGYA